VGKALTPHEQLASVRQAVMSLSWIEEDTAASAATEALSTRERKPAYCSAGPALHRLVPVFRHITVRTNIDVGLFPLMASSSKA